MKIVTILLFLLLTLPAFSQKKFNKSKISNEVIKITHNIAQINRLTGSAVGVGGVRPKQYNNFTLLREKANIDELRELTNHPNGVVRCYAFWALSYDSSVNLFPIVLDHIYDTANVGTQFGCIVSMEPVGEFFISIITPQRVDLKANKLDSLHLWQLDSILIYSSTTLWAKDAAISRVEPRETIYPKIRELVTNEHNGTALITLAKYHKEQDIPLILNNHINASYDEQGMSITYNAIIEFPHPQFFPLLENSLQKTVNKEEYEYEWRPLYQAIASYKNIQAATLLNAHYAGLKQNDERIYHIEDIFSAVSKFGDPVYDELLWKLWEKDKKINVATFQYLSGKDPDRIFHQIKESVKSPDQVLTASSGLGYDPSNTSGLLITAMLELVLKQDRKLGYEIIRKKIIEASVHSFSVFSEKAAEIKDSSFIDPLFERLEIEWNAHVYLAATKVLISYHDTAINHRIIETRKKNRNLSIDWGGKALDKLLEEHQIY